MSAKGLTDRYLPFLQSILIPQRLQHSVGVMRLIGELAEIYAVDRAKAMTAGLLHDIARDLELESQLALAEEAQITFSHPCERHQVYLHAPVGAYLASKSLGVTNGSILDAIATHAHFGDVGDFNTADTVLSWCLRFADILAPIQEWKGMRRLGSVVYEGRMEEAALLQCGWVIEYFREQGVPIHRNLVKHYQTLSARLGVGDSFFERW